MTNLFMWIKYLLKMWPTCSCGLQLLLSSQLHKVQNLLNNNNQSILSKLENIFEIYWLEKKFFHALNMQLRTWIKFIIKLRELIDRKTRISQYFLPRKRFKSSNVLFKWRFIWNYITVLLRLLGLKGSRAGPGQSMFIHWIVCFIPCLFTIKL